MRIAYIAPYQGLSLINQRNLKKNRSIAQSLKIELIAKAICSHGHEIEIISQGVALENQWKYFPSFNEPNLFHSRIPIYYASAFDTKILRGIWAKSRSLSILKRQHKKNPYELVIIYNLKAPQIKCAQYALDQLRIPVILEIEDDSFLTKSGEAKIRSIAKKYKVRYFLSKLSGCFGASPYLLKKTPSNIPKLLVRGVIGTDLQRLSTSQKIDKKNLVLYSGGLERIKGIEKLIKAWQNNEIHGWELHITGYGSLKDQISVMISGYPKIIFHGLVSREKLIHLMCSAKICINPHEVSKEPGNLFAFKIVEYLASGAHVISTPMGILEKEIENGMTYMADNNPKTISNTLNKVIETKKYKNISKKYVHKHYSVLSISDSLSELIQKAFFPSIS